MQRMLTLGALHNFALRESLALSLGGQVTSPPQKQAGAQPETNRAGSSKGLAASRPHCPFLQAAEAPGLTQGHKEKF